MRDIQRERLTALVSRDLVAFDLFITITPSAFLMHRPPPRPPTQRHLLLRLYPDSICLHFPSFTKSLFTIPLSLSPALSPPPYLLQTHWRFRVGLEVGVGGVSEKAGTAATTQTRNRDREEKRKKALTHLEREGKKNGEEWGGAEKKNHIWSHWIRRLYLFALHTCSPRCARVCVCARLWITAAAPRCTLGHQSKHTCTDTEGSERTSRCLCLR